MTVETTTRKSTQTMTIAVVEYTFAFRALLSTPTDIKCIRTNSDDNTQEDMEYVTEIPAPSTESDVLKYVVNINDDGVGGTVTVCWPSTTSTITIYRETSDTQSSDYEDYNQFPAETVENDFDKRTMKSQELAEDVNRALKYPITAPSGSTLPTPVADTYLGWDSAGVLLENKTLPDPSILVKASTGDAIAKTSDSVYMTPYATYYAARTMGSITITTGATTAMMDMAAATAGSLLVTTDATIAAAVITALTVTTINISSGTIAGAVTGVTQSAGDNSTKLATTAYADALIGGTGIPVACVLPYAAPTAPTGWLLCSGQAVSRTTYSTLFAAIGTAFGSGDGTTTFNVPDLRGRFPLGKDDMGGSAANRVTSASADTIGLGSGSESHTLTTDEIPAHTHSCPTDTYYDDTGGSSYNTGSNYIKTGSKSTGSAGGGTAHNNMSPYQTFNYIIKY